MARSNWTEVIDTAINAGVRQIEAAEDARFIGFITGITASTHSISITGTDIGGDNYVIERINSLSAPGMIYNYTFSDDTGMPVKQKTKKQLHIDKVKSNGRK